MGKLLAIGLLALVAACATKPQPSAERAAAVPAGPPPVLEARDAAFLDRVTWGADARGAHELHALGRAAWLERQLKAPVADDLPPQVEARIAAMTISQRPMVELASDLNERQIGVFGQPDDMKRVEQRRVLQEQRQRLARETAQRHVLRALHSPWQLREHMTWFWLNHFNVFAPKAEVRVYLADYEEKAIRPNALGSFRALLGATARHPAMLRYLDNALNQARALNENYARELMELHTMGVDGGYTQADVQELARVLTGIGLAYRPALRPMEGMRGDYVRDGIFEFVPSRHDYGRKVLLGEPIKASGLAELDEALDRLARHPSTARFVSRKLAVFFVSDDPSPALIERMAAVFVSSEGDIPSVLRTMFLSADFEASLGQKFKDPVHYVFSASRLAGVTEPMQILGWLGRLGQQLYARQTPDGYPMVRTGWSSAGQMATRFEVARAIGYAAPGRLAVRDHLGEATRATLDKASNEREWNMLYLASPEFMHR